MLTRCHCLRDLHCCSHRAASVSVVPTRAPVCVWPQDRKELESLRAQLFEKEKESLAAMRAALHSAFRPATPEDESLSYEQLKAMMDEKEAQVQVQHTHTS